MSETLPRGPCLQTGSWWGSLSGRSWAQRHSGVKTTRDQGPRDSESCGVAGTGRDRTLPALGTGFPTLAGVAQARG